MNLFGLVLLLLLIFDFIGWKGKSDIYTCNQLFSWPLIGHFRSDMNQLLRTLESDLIKIVFNTSELVRLQQDFTVTVDDNA